jgi:hypothetical protein
VGLSGIRRSRDVCTAVVAGRCLDDVANAPRHPPRVTGSLKP